MDVMPSATAASMSNLLGSLGGVAPSADGALPLTSARRAAIAIEQLAAVPQRGNAKLLQVLSRWAGSSLMIARDRHDCERIGAQCVALAEKFDLPVFRWNGHYLMGWAKAQGLTLSEGLALMEEAFPFVVNEQLYKLFGAGLAEARFDAGSATDALALVDYALNTEEGPASGL